MHKSESFSLTIVTQIFEVRNVEGGGEGADFEKRTFVLGISTDDSFFALLGFSPDFVRVFHQSTVFKNHIKSRI